eukprot:Tamp_12982.p1 GENE.Tamp_12982~~Tamp_12982.p1  ORF type:complete len:272 (+),score=12.68 Tamp_12982:831-1646(+)
MKEKESWERVLPIFFYNDTLFPFSPLSLHLFEPRYKVMCKRIVNGSRKFAYLPCFHSYTASVGDVGVVADLTDVEFLPDGRALLQAKCRERFHVLETWVEDGTQGLHWCKVAKLPDHESAAAAQGSAHDEAEAAARTRAVQVPAPTAAVSCTCALACACGSALPCISNTLSHACHACHACHQCLQSLSRPTRTRKCTHANKRRCMPLRRTRARACTRPHISACVPTNVCTYVCLRVYTEREASARASRPRGTGSVGDSVGEGTTHTYEHGT